MGFRDLPKWLDVPQLAPWSGRKVFSAGLELYRDNGEADWRERGEAEPVFGWWAVSLAGGAEGSRDTPPVLSRLGHSMFMFLWVCSLTQEKRLAIVRSVPYVVAYG